MVSNVKRLIVPPRGNFKYPIYVRTADDRYFIKIKSAIEATWLEFVDSEKFKVRATGFDECCEGEFLDVDFLVNVLQSMTENEYLARLREFTSHFEYVKTSLKL